MKTTQRRSATSSRSSKVEKTDSKTPKQNASAATNAKEALLRLHNAMVRVDATISAIREEGHTVNLSLIGGDRFCVRLAELPSNSYTSGTEEDEARLKLLE